MGQDAEAEETRQGQGREWMVLGERHPASADHLAEALCVVVHVVLGCAQGSRRNQVVNGDLVVSQKHLRARDTGECDCRRMVLDE
jgi:hypothetical protein